ncbi:MAG: hypothetical protein IJJ98_14980 [Prevotella sp.]|nr:hypothetical protein [Prevotella sp.]
MDYIFKDWEEKLSAFESSVEKDLAEIRKCKAEMQQIKLDVVAELQKGRYVRDTQRLVLSAPEIIIGNVDRSGTLFAGGSKVIVRGTQVGVEGAGEGGRLELRASSIRQTAEDPGTDGREHVVGSLSEVVSQARNIIIQSDDAVGAFSAPTAPTGGSGVRIHADKTIDVHAAMTAESREERLESLISETEKQTSYLKEQASAHKESFTNLKKELEELIGKRDELAKDYDNVRTNYREIRTQSEEIEALSMSITEETYAYAEILSLLAEANRRLKCFKEEKSKIKKGDDFTKNPTGAAVNITGENIRLTSADGENNLRDNESSGIAMAANSVGITSLDKDGALNKEGRVSIVAKNIEIATAGAADVKSNDEGELEKGTYTAEGDFTLKSKNITIESVDYEVADKKYKEKQLTEDSKIKLRAKTIEVSTEGSANVEVDEEGKLTKANYTSEGDIIVRSKTLTVESVDTDIENGEAKEKALTAEGKVAIRAEKTDIQATDTEGKATGSVNINAKAVAVKSMDVEKEKRTDDKLAEGSTMTILSEKMYVGAKSKEVKSKKVQVMSEEIGAFADKTLEIQQDEGKALVQLEGDNVSLGGTKAQIYGETTINGKTEVKDELKAPKVVGDSIEAKSAFKSPNISDGMAAGAGGGGGSLSAKLQSEDAPEEK